MSITDDALVAAARLADRYISDRFLPDKAIDLIDEAGSRMRIRRMTAPPDLREYDEKIAQVRREKESAIDSQDFEKAGALRDTEKQLIGKKEAREKEWKAGDMDVVAEVNEELIAEVLAVATGIPVFKLTEEESQRLLHMEDELHKRVIGQNAAIKALSQAIRRTRAGLKDPKRPGGSFIFAGPSGVGKTELSKTLAEFLFGEEDALIQLDMSEYMEKHTVSRLFGSPPGYVGYEEGGQLTEKVRRRPFSVVLFDEIEKAHPDIFNSLLQILEDGRLTDAQGRVVDFKNTVIIMTTNLGTRDISKGVSVGFARSGESKGSHDRMKAKVQEELKHHFRPEFLNRVDDTIVFHQLSQEEIVTIVDLMIAKVDERLKDRDMGLELLPAAKTLLSGAGLRSGARREAAAPDDPAGDRGQPVGEDPVRRAEGRPDRHGRCSGHRARSAAHVQGRAQARRDARRAARRDRQQGGRRRDRRAPDQRRRVAPPVRELARRYRVHRRLVRGALTSAWPGPRKAPRPRAPVLEPSIMSGTGRASCGRGGPPEHGAPSSSSRAKARRSAASRSLAVKVFIVSPLPHPQLPGQRSGPAARIGHRQPRPGSRPLRAP